MVGIREIIDLRVVYVLLAKEKDRFFATRDSRFRGTLRFRRLRVGPLSETNLSDY